jgi:hypothetical protein
MITGLPAYQPPVAEPVRCYCRSFFLLYTGVSDYQAQEVRRQAEDCGAFFIDSRETPFYQCECGQVLDFAPEASCMMQ